MSRDIRYAIYIDAKQADAELGRLHTQAVSAAGSEKMLAEATTKATTTLKQQTAVTSEAAKSTETFRQRIGKSAEGLSKQAAAISLVSSSLGESNGNVGKAVAGAGQLAAAYGAGGPLALALVGGLALVGQLTDHWKKLNDEEDRNIALKTAVVESMIDKTKALEKEVAALDRQSDPVKAHTADLAALEQQISDTHDAAIARAKVPLPFVVGEVHDDAVLARKNETGQLQKQEKLLLRKYELLLKIGSAAVPKTSTTSTRAAPKEAAEEVVDDDFSIGGLTIEDVRDDAIAREEVREEVRQQEGRRERAKEESITAAREKEQQIRRDSEDNDYEMRKQAALEFNAGLAQISMQGASIVASASTQLVSDLISGQEKALENFGLSIMAQAGQALVSYGVQAIGQGVLLATNPLTAAIAPASFAAGAGLIAAGVGLGGVAGGVGALMGKSDKDAAGSVTTPRSSSSTSHHGGGGTSYTIIYSPTRDQAASAVAVAGTTADARGFSKTKVR